MSDTDVGGKKNFRAVIGKLNLFKSKAKEEIVKGDVATKKDKKILENMTGGSSGIPTKSFKEMANYRKKRIRRNKLARISKQRNR